MQAPSVARPVLVDTAVAHPGPVPYVALVHRSVVQLPPLTMAATPPPSPLAFGERAVPFLQGATETAAGAAARPSDIPRNELGEGVGALISGIRSVFADTVAGAVAPRTDTAGPAVAAAPAAVAPAVGTVSHETRVIDGDAAATVAAGTTLVVPFVPHKTAHCGYSMLTELRVRLATMSGAMAMLCAILGTVEDVAYHDADTPGVVLCSRDEVLVMEEAASRARRAVSCVILEIPLKRNMSLAYLCGIEGACAEAACRCALVSSHTRGESSVLGPQSTSAHAGMELALWVPKEPLPAASHWLRDGPTALRLITPQILGSVVPSATPWMEPFFFLHGIRMSLAADGAHTATGRSQTAASACAAFPVVATGPRAYEQVGVPLEGVFDIQILRVFKDTFPGTHVALNCATGTCSIGSTYGGDGGGETGRSDGVVTGGGGGSGGGAVAAAAAAIKRNHRAMMDGQETAEQGQRTRARHHPAA